MNKIYRRTFDLTATVGTAVYADGDAIGALHTITEAGREADQSGVLEQIILLDEAGQDGAIDLFFYRSAVTGGTDNAAYAPTDAVLADCVGIVSIAAADYKAAGTPSVATVTVNLPFQLENTRNLFFQIVSRGTPDYVAATDLKFRFVIKSD